jgi:transposase-like protein
MRSAEKTAISSIAGKIGCSPYTLLEWVKKADCDSGRSPGVPSEVAAKLKERPFRRGLRRCRYQCDYVPGMPQ